MRSSDPCHWSRRLRNSSLTHLVTSNCSANLCAACDLRYHDGIGRGITGSQDIYRRRALGGQQWIVKATLKPGDLIGQARAIQSQVMTPENSLQIRELLRKALAEPVGVELRRLAEAWCFLAEVLMCDYLNRWNGSGATEFAEAENAVQHALEIAPGIAAAHYTSGLIHRAKGEHEAALAAFTRTVELSPEFALAYAQQGAQLIYTGRPLDAVQPIETAIRISRANNPSRPMFYWYLGRAHFVAGNYVGGNQSSAAICRRARQRLVQSSSSRQRVCAQRR